MKHINADDVMTTRRLLIEPNLRLSVVVAPPQALDRTIGWVHVAEVVDPRPHVRTDELVCTVGSALLHPRDALRFVSAIKDEQCVGICLGLGEVHTEVPAALERACRRLGVMLLVMAHGVPFRALSDVIANPTSATEADDVVGVAMERLRDGATVQELLALAMEEMNGRLEIRQRADPDPSSPELTGARSMDVVLDDGEFLRWIGFGALPSTAALERFARIVHVARRAQLAQESENRQRVGQLMTLVVDGLAHPAALAPDLERAGIDSDRLWVSAWPEGSGLLVSRQLSGALIAETPNGVLVLTRDESSVRRASDDLQLVFGFSNPVSLVDVAHGIAEARATFMLARKRGSIAGPESLATLSALLEQQPRSRLTPFAHQLIRPLLEPGVRNGPELLMTLREFFENHDSVAATASALFVHVNTVRHRLDRISAIVGRNPLSRDDRTDLAIALWAHDQMTRRAEPSRGR